jgi:hypothetical protein
MMMYLARQPVAEPDLSLFPERWTRDGVIFVSTHCLYADGQNVTVELRRRADGLWDVTDGRGGLEALSDNLIEPSTRMLTRTAKAIADQTSVSFHDGAWTLRDNTEQQIAASVILVANASQRWINGLFAKQPVYELDHIEDDIFDRLVAHFGLSKVTQNGLILGESTRPYSFSAIVHLANDRSAAFTAASPHGGSINSAYTKLMDVRCGENRPAFMGVVIRNASGWASEDIALIRRACDDVVEDGAPLERVVAKLAAVA